MIIRFLFRFQIRKKNSGSLSYKAYFQTFACNPLLTYQYPDFRFGHRKLLHLSQAIAMVLPEMLINYYGNCQFEDIFIGSTVLFL